MTGNASFKKEAPFMSTKNHLWAPTIAGEFARSTLILKSWISYTTLDIELCIINNMRYAIVAEFLAMAN